MVVVNVKPEVPSTGVPVGVGEGVGLGEGVSTGAVAVGDACAALVPTPPSSRREPKPARSPLPANTIRTSATHRPDGRACAAFLITPNRPLANGAKSQHRAPRCGRQASL